MILISWRSEDKKWGNQIWVGGLEDAIFVVKFFIKLAKKHKCL